jgi:hypothetical protein
MSTSQSGLSLRKLSSEVVRHRPRGLLASCHGLNSFLPRRLGNGMLSGRSKITFSVSRSAAKRAEPNRCIVAAFCASTQASARSLSISSSHK